jgi:hypothetical protein
MEMGIARGSDWRRVRLVAVARTLLVVNELLLAYYAWLVLPVDIGGSTLLGQVYASAFVFAVVTANSMVLGGGRQRAWRCAGVLTVRSFGRGRGSRSTLATVCCWLPSYSASTEARPATLSKQQRPPPGGRRRRTATASRVPRGCYAPAVSSACVTSTSSCLTADTGLPDTMRMRSRYRPSILAKSPTITARLGCV